MKLHAYTLLFQIQTNNNNLASIKELKEHIEIADAVNKSFRLWVCV